MESKVDSDNILKGSISSASYSMVFQIVFRIISFSINGIFLHNVDKEVLGVINVRMMLLYSTILFISREAFRRACLSNTRSHNWPQVINLIWLTVPNMMLWTTIFCYIWLNWLALPSEEILKDYKFAVYMMGISCIMESFVEPIYLFSQAFLYVRLRLSVDIITLIVRIASLTLTVLLSPKHTMQAFAWGSMAGSGGLLLIYAGYFYLQFRKKRNLLKNKELHANDPLMILPFDSLSDFLPKKIEGQTFIGYELAQLTWGFFKQGLMKQVLTEGERYIMTIFSVLSFAEQGIYDVVNNLGSLAARFLFLPIEESSYFYFAQMLHRDKPIDQQPKADVEKAAHVLYVLLKGLTLLGLIILVFGFSYSHFLLSIYGGRTLTDGPGPLLLRTHCVCVLLLGINGVTEAFVFAAMNKTQLDRHNIAMAVFTSIFLGLAWLLSSLLGGVGFILANCVNMSLRICYSVSFIRNHYQNSGENPLRALVLSKIQLVAYFVAFLVTAWSESFIYPTSAILHLFIGAICGVSILATVFFTEEELRSYLMAIVKKKIGRKEE